MELYIQCFWFKKMFRESLLFFELIFNNVNHEILLSKLKGYKVKGSMLNLRQSYLNNRSQSTVINNVVSEREIVNVGKRKVLV